MLKFLPQKFLSNGLSLYVYVDSQVFLIHRSLRTTADVKAYAIFLIVF